MLLLLVLLTLSLVVIRKRFVADKVVISGCESRITTLFLYSLCSVVSVVDDELLEENNIHCKVQSNN